MEASNRYPGANTRLKPVPTCAILIRKMRLSLTPEDEVNEGGLRSLPPPSGISFDLVDTSDIIKSPNKMAVLLEITIVSIGVSVEILNFAQELTCLQNYCLAPRSLARLCVADAYT